MTSKSGGVVVPGKAWRISTYWPGGVRCKGDATLIQAFVRNLRTWLLMEREKAQAQQREAESTDARARGGLPRSSGAIPVERRGQVTHVRMESTGNRRNSLSWRKPAGFLRVARAG